MSSHILKVLIHEAQNFLEEDIDRVVIWSLVWDALAFHAHACSDGIEHK